MLLPIASTGDKYVAAAYIVFLALVLLYVAITASKLARTEKELHELNETLDKKRVKESVSR